jgi:hypothetical protein
MTQHLTVAGVDFGLCEWRLENRDQRDNAFCEGFAGQLREGPKTLLRTDVPVILAQPEKSPNPRNNPRPKAFMKA